MWIIGAHAGAALAALLLGAGLLVGAKGTRAHRAVGWAYVAVMTVVAVSAAFIQEIRPNAFSVIHLLIPFALGSLVHAILSIRRYRRDRDPRFLRAHKNAMIGLFLGALVVAGAFTLLPGRMMRALLFG